MPTIKYANQRRYVQRNIAAGKCPHCGGTPAPGKRNCAARIEYWRQRTKKRATRRSR